MKKFAYLIAWVVMVIFLSLLPKSSIDTSKIKLFEGADKVVHFTMYMILMILWIKAFNFKIINSRNNRFLVLGVLFSVSLGIVLEFLQKYLVLGRSFDTFDIAANILGVIFAVILFKRLNY